MQAASSTARRATVIDTTEGLREHQERVSAEAAALLSHLSPMELETLALIASGYPQAHAAIVLGTSRVTVAKYLWSAAGKTGIRGRVALIRLALRGGIASVWEDPRLQGPPGQPGRPGTRLAAC